MRTILIALSLVVITIISIPLYLIEFIIGSFNPKLKHTIAQFVVRWVFRLWIWMSGIEYTIIGRDRVPTDEPILYVANHRSIYDAFLGYAFVPTQTCFVAKKSIKKLPCIAQWMYFLNCRFLDRDDIKSGLQMMKDCIGLIENGYSVFISPEGTRHAYDEMLPFKEGSFKIATRTNCKIVPVCYTNTENIFETHIPWIKKTKNVTMEFGEAVDISNLERIEKKQLGVKFHDIIQDMYNERRNK